MSETISGQPDVSMWRRIEDEVQGAKGGAIYVRTVMLSKSLKLMAEVEQRLTPAIISWDSLLGPDQQVLQCDLQRYHFAGYGLGSLVHAGCLPPHFMSVCKASWILQESVLAGV